MSKEQEPRQSRATTHFKFYSERWIFGSTRSELTPEERSVFIDILCLASFNFGEVECFSRDQLAAQLFIPRELLDSSINKCIKYGKIISVNNEEEKKEVFRIAKWDQYQEDYLKKRAKRAGIYDEKERIEKTEESDTENQPILKERRGDDITLNNTTGEEIKEDDSKFPDGLNFISEETIPLHSNSNNFSEEEINLLREKFLSKLRECPGYSYHESQAEGFFRLMLENYPGIDILAELDKKIVWWKEHPEALKSGSKHPHDQLEDWFEKEHEFQKGKAQ